MISDEQLKAYCAEGLIPGPAENETEYLQRVDYCLSLKKSFKERLGNGMATDPAGEDLSFWEEAWKKTEELYGIHPTWIPLFFSNSQLPFWQGGCAWIFQQDDKSPVSAFLQLRRAFRTAPLYLGLYHRDELLAHEMCHVGRMCFQEPQFEEVLAYRSSPSHFRRWLGPLVQAPWESSLFVLLLFFILVLDFFVLWMQPELFFHIAWLKLLPFALLIYGIFRVYKRQQTLQTTLAHLQELIPDFAKSQALLYRLTDQEIHAFAKLTPQEITRYAHAQPSLLWRSNILVFSL